jgi:hypothetical protein
MSSPLDDSVAPLPAKIYSPSKGSLCLQDFFRTDDDDEDDEDDHEDFTESMTMEVDNFFPRRKRKFPYAA